MSTDPPAIVRGEGDRAPPRSTRAEPYRGPSIAWGSPKEIARAPLEDGAGAVAWSPDGETLYVGSETMGVLRWPRAFDRAPGPWLETKEGVDALALDPSGTRLAWAGGTTGGLIDVESRTSLHRLTHEDLVASLVVGPTHVVSIDLRNESRTYDHVAARSLPVQQVDTLHSLSVGGTADGTLVATGGYGSIELSGTGVGFTIEMPRCRDRPSQLACVRWAETRVEEFGAEGSPPTTHIEEAPEWYVHDVTFAPDRRTLAAGRSDGAVLVVGIADKAVIQRFETDPEGALRVAYSPDGELLAVGGRSGRLDVIRRRDGMTASVEAHAHGIDDLAISTTGLLATASYDGVAVWRLEP